MGGNICIMNKGLRCMIPMEDVLTQITDSKTVLETVPNEKKSPYKKAVISNGSKK